MLKDKDKKRVIQWINERMENERLTGFRKEAIFAQLQIDIDDLELYLKEIVEANTLIQMEHNNRCSNCGATVCGNNKSCVICNCKSTYVDVIYKYKRG